MALVLDRSLFSDNSLVDSCQVVYLYSFPISAEVISIPLNRSRNIPGGWLTFSGL